MPLFQARRPAKAKSPDLRLCHCNGGTSHATITFNLHGAIMRHLSGLFAVLALALLAGGCASPKQDIATIESYGGRVTPTYEAEWAGIPPMQAVDFSPERRLLTDEDFATLLP